MGVKRTGVSEVGDLKRTKDWIVASVFNVVMMIGYSDLVAVGVLIGLFTLLNLTVHRVVEQRDSWLDRGLVFGLIFMVMGFVWFNIGFSWFFVVWLVFVLG